MFRRLLQRVGLSSPAPDPQSLFLSSGAESFFQRVAGESYHQDALRALSAAHAADGGTCTVFLRPEVGNPHDATAVVVATTTERLGYLPREHAAQFWPLLRELETTHARVASCGARVTGGTPDRPLFGLTLDLLSVGECEARLRELAEPVVAEPGAARRSAVLRECETEAERLSKWGMVFRPSETDLGAGAALLSRAIHAGLADALPVKRLDFLLRLYGALVAGAVEDDAVDAFVAQARVLDLSEIAPIQGMRRYQRLEALKARGPEPVTRDARGRAVYLQCEAEYRNKPGQLEVRDDGMTFVGEVVVEVPWSNVVHAAPTTHTYQGVDYRAVAVQEGKRRTPTKFAFPRSGDGEYASELIPRVWERSKAPPA